LQVPVADPERHDEPTESAHVRHGLFGAPHRGLAHDLEERRARAVVVEERAALALAVDALARVFFDVDARERHRARAFARLDDDVAALADRRVVL